MLTADVIAFVRASLPPPPSRILEIGAGRGELAAQLRDAGYDVTAIDPAAELGTGVKPVALIDAEGMFDAAVAIVSLHHVEPLEASCDHLATLIVPGGRLVIDELDIERYDDRATQWWVTQRLALGDGHTDRDPSEIVAHMRAHIHPLDSGLRRAPRTLHVRRAGPRTVPASLGAAPQPRRGRDRVDRPGASSGDRGTARRDARRLTAAREESSGSAATGVTMTR